MTLELIQAVVTFVRFCTEQKNCNTCPLRKCCGKMPCEW